MDREMDVNTVLDYAVFQKSSSQNRYETLVFSKGKTETKGFQSNSSTNGIKLQLPESLKGSYWFTKFTLARFLHVVNSAEMLKSANTIENEMSQLEDTRRFHLAVYAKEHPDHSAGAVIAPPPPSDPTIKKIADKLASFVAKVGRRFEDITRQRNPGDTPFNEFVSNVWCIKNLSPREV